MTARRLLAALAATAVAFGLLQPAPAVAATTTPTITVAPEDGGVIAKGRLVVDVTVTNTGDTALPAGELGFSMDASPLASTTALLGALASPPSDLQGYLLHRTTATTDEIEPGGSDRVRVRIDRDDLTETVSDASGARLLYVRFRTATGEQQVAEAVVTRMSGKAPSVGLGTVVPLTAPANTIGIVDTDAQQTLTAPGGAWDTALRAAQAMPSAVVALDPEVIASIRLAGDSAPGSATEFLDALEALPNEVVELPYADGDLTLERAAGLTVPLAPGSFAGSSAAPATTGATASPSPAATPQPTATAGADGLTDWAWSDTRIAWPVPGSTSAAALPTLAADGRWVLLGSRDVRGWTSSPGTTVGGRDALVADASASGLLATAAGGGTSGDAALATLVGVLATDAVAGSVGAVLAVPSRAAEPSGLPRVLGLLADQRWIEGRSLADLTSAASGSARLVPGGVPAARTSTLRPVQEAEAAVQALGEGMDDPGEVTGPQRLALLALLSAGWRSDDAGWASAVSTATTGARGTLDRVRIVSSGSVTALGTDGGVPVTLVNELPEPVTVVVRGTASNGRIRFTDPTLRVTVPAGAGRGARMPANTISNGRVQVSLQLETVGGDAIGPVVQRDVTVRAGFDTVVAVILLVALGALLVLGVYRNVTRRRPRRRA